MISLNITADGEVNHSKLEDHNVTYIEVAALIYEMEKVKSILLDWEFEDSITIEDNGEDESSDTE